MLEITSNLEVIWSIEKHMYRLCANSSPYIFRTSASGDFDMLDGSWNTHEY